MSDSSDLDEFENFDQELEQMQSEEEVEQRQENRLLSVKEKLIAMSSRFNSEIDTAQTQKEEQETSTADSDPEGCRCAPGGRSNR